MSGRKILTGYLLSVILCLGPAAARADDHRADSLAFVRGILLDSQNARFDHGRYQGTVPDAILELAAGGDTLRLQADRFGGFRFPGVRPGTAVLRVTRLGYQSYEGRYDLGRGNNEIFIYLHKQTEQLQEASVTDEAPLVRSVGDTLIYNARLMGSLEGDDAMALFLQIPGAELRSGKPYIGGEPVARTYIGGRLIFGDDPRSALDALPAAEVTEMKVYQEETDEDRRAGNRYGRRQRVLDIQTRSEVLSAADAHALISGGADQATSDDGKVQPRYGGGITANLYSEMLLLSLNTFADNIDRHSNRFDSFTASGSSPASYSGLTTYDETIHVATSAQKYWGDRLDGNNIALQYRYNRDYIRDRSRSLLEYFPTDATPYSRYADTLFSSSVQSSHTAQISGSLYSGRIGRNQFSVTFNTFRQESSRDDHASLTGTGTDFRRNQTDLQHTQNYLLSGRYDYHAERAFGAWSPTLGIGVELGRNDNPSWSIDTLSSTTLKRHLETSAAGDHQKVILQPGLQATLLNDSRNTLSALFQYDFTYQSRQNVQTAYDVLLKQWDATNTADFTYRYRYHGLMTALTWSRPAFSVTARLQARWDILMDDERIPAYTLPKIRYFGLLPGLTVQGKDWSAWLRTERRLPSLEQVRDRVDQDNPLLLRTGNAAIKPSDILSLYANKSWSFPATSQFLLLFLMTDLTLNPMVVRTRTFTKATLIPAWTSYLAPAGARLVTWDNAPYSLSASLNATWQKRWKQPRTSLTTTLSADYNRQPVWTEESLAYLSEFHPSARLQLTMTPHKNLRFNTMINGTFIRSASSLGPVTRALTAYLHAALDWRFAQVGFLMMEDTHTVYHFFSGYGQDTRRNVLNAAVGCRLLGGSLILSLSGHDLLHSGFNYTYQQSADSITQNWTPSFGRYFLVNIAFRFTRAGSATRFRGTLSDGTGTAFTNLSGDAIH